MDKVVAVISLKTLSIDEVYTLIDREAEAEITRVKGRNREATEQLQKMN